VPQLEPLPLLVSLHCRVPLEQSQELVVHGLELQEPPALHGLQLPWLQTISVPQEVPLLTLWQVPLLQVLQAGQPVWPLVQHVVLETQVLPHGFWPPGQLPVRWARF
jgi:hypothetical protein